MGRRLQIPGIKEFPHLRAAFIAECDAAIMAAALRGCPGDCGGDLGRIASKFKKLISEAGKKRK